MQYDKKLHLIAGAIIAAIFYYLTHSHLVAISAATMIGLLKEVYDSFFPHRHTVDPVDFVVTAIGGVLFSATCIISTLL